MFFNLKAEMARIGLTTRAIAREKKIGESSLYNKINGKSDFKLSEMLKIQSTWFPEFTLEYLFAVNQRVIKSNPPTEPTKLINHKRGSGIGKGDIQ